MPRMDKLSSYKTTYLDDEEGGIVIYHQTAIVRWQHGIKGTIIRLNSNGWQTVTTKRKLNQASSQFCLGFSVYQKNYDWFVTKPDGETVPYVDGMEFIR